MASRVQCGAPRVDASLLANTPRVPAHCARRLVCLSASCSRVAISGEQLGGAERAKHGIGSRVKRVHPLGQFYLADAGGDAVALKIQGCFPFVCLSPLSRQRRDSGVVRQLASNRTLHAAPDSGYANPQAEAAKFPANFVRSAWR